MYGWNPNPEARQAKLQVGLTTSPTLSLNDPNAEWEVYVNLHILQSKSPGEPITFLTYRTVFDVFEKGEGGMYMFSRGAFGRLRGIDGDGKMTGAHPLGWVSRARFIYRGLRPLIFVRARALWSLYLGPILSLWRASVVFAGTYHSGTLSPDSLGLFHVNEIMKSDTLDLRERGCSFLSIPGDRSLVTITHKLGWGRIFKYEEKLTKKDLSLGDRFQIGASNKFIGTGW